MLLRVCFHLIMSPQVVRGLGFGLEESGHIDPGAGTNAPIFERCGVVVSRAWVGDSVGTTSRLSCTSSVEGRNAEGSFHLE